MGTADRVPLVKEDEDPDDILSGIPPTIDEECPGCGGRVQVWVYHSHGAGFTQCVRHVPNREDFDPTEEFCRE